jgi:hypothetical protein
VENNPVNFNDPMGREINLTGHRVQFGFIKTKHAHFAIQVVPDDQTYWTNNSAVQLEPLNDGTGRHYFTISGKATGSVPFLGDLELVFHKPSDLPSKNFAVGPIGIPSGASENEYIHTLLDATTYYNQNRVDYDILPEFLPGSGSNSTGGSFGLIQATGGSLPNTSSLPGGLGTAGAATPVPPQNFGVSGSSSSSGGQSLYPSTPSTSFISNVYCKGC